MSKSVFIITACLMLLAPLGLNAQVWEPDLRLTNEASSSRSPSVAASGSGVHVVWYDYRDSNWEIYYKRSSDGGASWGIDTRLTSAYGYSQNPSVATSDDTVHVVWGDDRDGNWEIYYKRSNSWGPDIRLTNASAYSTGPSVAVSGSTVHVVWTDNRDGNYEIYYKRSTDGGASWSTDTNLTNDAGRSGNSSVAVSGSAVHVVWEDNRDGNYEIYCKRSTDGGASWGTDTRLTNDDSTSNYPSVATSGDIVHVVWVDYPESYAEIYYKRSTDGGVNWETDTRLTNADYYSHNPSVEVSGSAIHVVWCDIRDDNPEIYYKRSTDGGGTWGTDTRLTNDVNTSWRTSVAASGSNIHVVWQDNRDGNDEIYYKHGGEMQPDNLVKNSDESEYTGDDVYNDNGTDQTKGQTVAPGDTATYHIRIENDGDLSDTVTVTGTGSVEGWTVYYYDALEGGTDITSDVTGSGWSIQDLDQEDYTEIRVEVSPDEEVPEDSTYDVLVTSTSERDDTKLDAVKAETTVQGEHQPDNRIKNFEEAAYIGNDIYNTDGTNQTKSQAVDAGNTAIYHIYVENDGSVIDTIIITGTAPSSSWDVRYFDAIAEGNDITSEVILPTVGWSTGALVSGEFEVIRVEVTPVSASEGSSFDALVISTSKMDDARKDAVKATTTVGTGVEEDVPSVPLVYSLEVSSLSTGKAVVSYALPQASNVTLLIYDAAGRAAKTYEFAKVEAGSHDVELDNVSLSKGVYFVQLKAGEKVLTRKLVLTR